MRKRIRQIATQSLHPYFLQTSQPSLREVDFQFEGHELRGFEQNPETGSRWVRLARQRKKVMQFLKQRRYVAVVMDGKVQFYGRYNVAGALEGCAR